MTGCADFADTVALDTLMRHIVPVINTLPYELGEGLLRQAFTEFCRRTETLTSNQEILPQKDVEDYELIPPEGYEVYKVRGLGRGESYELTPNAHYWYAGFGARFYVDGNKYIVLRYSPNRDSDVPFYVNYSVLPDECVTRIPREIAIPYGNIIAKKALSEALLFKSKPWYDPALAAMYKREFHNGVQSGINLNLMNRGAQPMRARTRRWV